MFGICDAGVYNSTRFWSNPLTHQKVTDGPEVPILYLQRILSLRKSCRSSFGTKNVLANDCLRSGGYYDPNSDAVVLP